MAVALAALPSLLGGCASSPPDMEPGRLVADAAGLETAIALHDALPLDLDAPRPDRLTRADASALAVRNRPDVQAALADVQAALATARQARLLSNPVLDLNVRFGGESEVVEAALAQPLIDLLARPARSRMADARLRASAQRAVEAALDVLRETEATYARAIAAEAQLDLLDQQAELLDRLLAVAEARRAAGEATRLDVVGFLARQAALNARSIGTRAEADSSRLTLARLIGQPSTDAAFDLDADRSATEIPGEADTLRVALKSRPEVQAQLLELAALGEEVRLARLDVFEGLAAGVEAETEDSASAGPAVSLPIPIFDFGTTARDAASAEVLAARHRLTGLGRRVIEEVRQARVALLAAEEAASSVGQTLLPLQRDRVDQTRAAYEAGFADVTDVLAAEGDLLEAEATLVDARLRRDLAAADLRRATAGVADDSMDNPFLADLSARPGSRP